jgi:hypothetical protein
VFLSVLGQLCNQNALGCTRFGQRLQERPDLLLGFNCTVVFYQRFVLSLDSVGDFL